MNDNMTIELIKRIEAMETKFSSLRTLALSLLDTVDAVEYMMGKFQWLAIGTINSHSLFISEINELREKLGMPKYTEEEIVEKLNKTIEGAKRAFIVMMNEMDKEG